MTTIVSFLPVFTMEAAEGKLFKPLAYTKTFALIASVIVALTVIPPFAHLLFTWKLGNRFAKKIAGAALAAVGIVALIKLSVWVGLAMILWGVYSLFEDRIPARFKRFGPLTVNYIAVLMVAILLTEHWLPLGPGKGLLLNALFVAVALGVLLLLFHFFARVYPCLLRWCLDHKAAFLALPTVLLLTGVSVWLGFERTFSILPGIHDGSDTVMGRLWSGPKSAFPGLGKEFMPPLDEGSYLYMPTTMPHASIGEALDVLQKLDMSMAAIPEVASVVGKLGRADSPLDPAPVSMVETVVNYVPEYRLDRDGRRLRFRFDKRTDEFARDGDGELIPDPHGRAYRQWRDEITSPDDIWDEIVRVTKLPGTTSAPRLQPIAARIVMLQSGMRAPMGVKVKGPSLEAIEDVGLQIERFLKEVPSIQREAVIADRIVGKPYLEIDIDREAIGRYGLTVGDVQDVIEIAIGGRQVTTTVEGRERYPVRVRYARELRDTIEDLVDVRVPTVGGAQIPLGQLTEIRYVRGPQVIKSEDTFLIGYVLFDMLKGQAEVDVVEAARTHLAQKLESGEFVLPEGVRYTFAGSYENQVRSAKKLMVVLPLALFLIFMILYFQFRSVVTTGMVFSGIFVAWAGGFLMIWLYGQPWFLDFAIFGTGMRELFQVHPINLSVAIWVGFIALFGIASDDGVVMATYLDQTFARKRHTDVGAIRRATIEGARRRVRPAMMTTATTILALLPVLTSTGRGSDIMVPMAIPSFGGMAIEVLTILVVPVLYCGYAEFRLRLSGGH